jgi:UDP-N-acetylmuramoyl-tripeptide--D-alanyl-D-alanine ligase
MHGELRQGAGEALVGRICTDSRAAQAGDLFFALKGDKFDAHDFLDEVAGKGVAACVVARGKKFPVGTVIEVDNPRAALGRLAAAYRGQFSLPVIAVGGSNGKTTTKELLAAVLRQKFSTLASEASFNNDIGVPLTLLQLTASHQAAVVEVGTNHPGELAPLVTMTQPKFGVITSVGREHLEFFGDVAGVAQEEGALAELLPVTGKLFINGDSEWAVSIAKRATAKVARVGLGEGNCWRATAVRFEKRGMSFAVTAPKPEFSGEYVINLLGRHQVVNALFAIAVGAELSLMREEILRGLASCQPPKMRLQIWEAGGVTVLDDCYNANADSMRAALEVLSELPCKGRRLAVLGDMAELGAHRDAAHAEVGALAAKLGVGQLLAVGKNAGLVAQAARAAGLNRVMEFADAAAAADGLQKLVKAGDVVLLKASRAVRLERAAEFLKANVSGK